MARNVIRPKIALIGRPNVGKSTLFNRLTGRRTAIVDELPGVTRDRLYGTCEWSGYEFTVIDCGGIGPESEDPLWEPVAGNARQAMAEADAIVFLVDARTGPTLSDDAVVKELRRQKKPVLVAANKVESLKQEPNAYEFYSLGYPDLFLTSALTGTGVGELLDRLIELLDWTKWPKAVPEFAAWRYGEGGERGSGQGVDYNDVDQAPDKAVELEDWDEGDVDDEESEEDEGDEAGESPVLRDPLTRIIEYFRRKHNLQIGQRTADRIKQTLFDAPASSNPKDLPAEIRGMDLTTNQARVIEVTTQDIREALSKEYDNTTPEAELPDLTPEDYPFAWSGGPPRFVPDESWRGEAIRMVLVGRQNTGKSSLTNALLGEHRALVAELPGTTRDPLFAEFTRLNQRFELLDTAGMIRVSRMKLDVDYYSLVRAEKSMRRSEVAVLVLDALAGVSEQDKRVASKIAEDGLAVVVVVNKRDLLKGPDGSPAGPAEYGVYRDFLYDELGKLRWANVVFTCALTGAGLDELCRAAVAAWENYHKRIDNKALQAVLTEQITLNPPPVVKNRELRFFDFRQIGNCPPTFLIECNDKLNMRQAYKRFLENAVRRYFDFTGTHLGFVYYTRKKGRRKRN